MFNLSTPRTVKSPAETCWLFRIQGYGFGLRDCNFGFGLEIRGLHGPNQQCGLSVSPHQPMKREREREKRTDGGRESERDRERQGETAREREREETGRDAERETGERGIDTYVHTCIHAYMRT